MRTPLQTSACAVPLGWGELGLIGLGYRWIGLVWIMLGSLGLACTGSNLGSGRLDWVGLGGIGVGRVSSDWRGLDLDEID